MKSISILFICLSASSLAAQGDLPVEGSWRAWLESPGGKLEFGIELTQVGDQLEASLVNGEERIAVPRVTLHDGQLRLHIDHYDAMILADISPNGRRLDGEWSKVTGKSRTSRLPFHAEHKKHKASNSQATQPGATPSEIDGRWAVKFSKSDDPAIGLFNTRPNGRVSGTFLTTTGDYRFLDGSYRDGRLRLSCFDGAHAFLFVARKTACNRLEGDFWSRDVWYESWTATRDATVELPSGFELSKWSGPLPLAEMKFRDLDGVERSLLSVAPDGKVRMIEIFGSWCPNCHDAAGHLVELDKKYSDRGLSIVALAFELTGEFERDVRQARRFARRHGVGFPVLIAGISDKFKAAQVLPGFERIKAYPTTIFVDRGGRVRKVHTGFAGPATGDAHESLKAEFASVVDTLLSDPPY